MQDDIRRVLLTRDQIGGRVVELAGDIQRVYDGQTDSLVILPILSGAMIFLADLIRQLPLRMRIGLVGISSYPGKATRSQGPTVTCSSNLDVQGQHVLIVDDILDTGGTLRRVLADLATLSPASLRTCVLLRKPDKAPADLVPDFVGFDIEDVFVVGYGLDYDNHYRNWPDIVELKPECYVAE